MWTVWPLWQARSAKAAPVPAVSTLGGHKTRHEGSGPRIVGEHPAIARVLQLARQVAGSARYSADYR